MAAFRSVMTTLALATVMAAPAVAQQRERRRPTDSGNQPQQTERAREQQPARGRDQAQPRERAVPRQEAQTQRQDQVRREQQSRAAEQQRAEAARRNDNRGYQNNRDNRGYDNRGYDTRGYQNNRGYDSRRYDNRGYNSRDYAVRRLPPRIIRPQVVRVVAYRPYTYRPSLRLGVYYGYDGYYPYGYTPRGYFEPIPGRLYGGVRITGAPRDAQVFADGYYVGIVNDFDGIFQHINLEAGPHHIEVDLGSYEPIAFDVYVRPGETTTFRADGYFGGY